MLRASARCVGAPLEEARSDHLARALFGDIAGGRPPSPGLRRALVDALERFDPPANGSLGDLARWIGVTDDVRAEALENLLGLADAIPTRRHELVFPHPSSTPHG
jgi:hypothetical protein